MNGFENEWTNEPESIGRVDDLGTGSVPVEGAHNPMPAAAEPEAGAPRAVGKSVDPHSLRRRFLFQMVKMFNQITFKWLRCSIKLLSNG